MRIAVFGAGGQLGAAIAAEFETSHDVVRFVRSDIDAAVLGFAVILITGSIGLPMMLP